MGIFDLLSVKSSIASWPTIFDVSDVKKATRPLREISYRRAVELLLTTPARSRANSKQSKIEACSQYRSKLIASVKFHPFIAALHQAFNDHRPLSLSPDMMWLLIAQGLADWINSHSEELRSHFVKHQDKVKIVVICDDFVKGNPRNDWTNVLTELSTSIRQHIGGVTHDLLVPTFSTTGVVEKAASEIVLLEAMQSYFELEVDTLCGIPQIQLEGTIADWQQLLERITQIDRFQLEWWVDALIPILEQFVLTAEGKPDRDFWRSMYKYNDDSGDAIVTGWITRFFPYLNNERSVPVSIRQRQFYQDREIQVSSFPSGLAKAPFTWKYLDRNYPMEFIGGFMGVKQDRHSLFLRPEIGWVVREVKTNRLF
jgi:Domain of unknown function (DUF4419)